MHRIAIRESVETSRARKKIETRISFHGARRGTGGDIDAFFRSAPYRIAARHPRLDQKLRAYYRGKILVLMYHELADDGDDIEAWTVVRKSSFVEQVGYLQDIFDIVSLEHAIERLPFGGDSDRPMAVITFDDGSHGNYDVLLPAVESLCVPVSIFLATGAIETQTPYWFDRLITTLQSDALIAVSIDGCGDGWYEINRRRGPRNWNEIERLLVDLKRLNPDAREEIVDQIVSQLPQPPRSRYKLRPFSVEQVRVLARHPLIHLGAHSHCHNILVQLNEVQIDASVRRCKQLIRQWTGSWPKYFCYPNGDYDERVAVAVRRHGFRCGLATIPKPWEKTDSLFAIPRIGVGRYDSLDRFRIKLLGGLKKTVL